MKKPSDSNLAPAPKGREKLAAAIAENMKLKTAAPAKPSTFNPTITTAKMIEQYQAEISQREKEIDVRRERIGYLRGVIDTLRAVTKQVQAGAGDSNGVGANGK